MGSIEILSPAGGAQQLAAAVRSGADAVYLGAGAFNARAKAETVCFFGVDELPKGAVVFSAKSVNCYGRAGAAISSAAIATSAS